MLKNYMYEQKVDFQLVPPHDHRNNPSERAIQKCKNHFISGLCGVDPDFPMNLWYFLLKHCDITLNILQESRIKPKLSAYTQVCGEFDFNQTPLAPPDQKFPTMRHHHKAQLTHRMESRVGTLVQKWSTIGVMSAM